MHDMLRPQPTNILMFPVAIYDATMLNTLLSKELSYQGIIDIKAVADEGANWQVTFSDGYKLFVTVSPSSLYFPPNHNENAALMPIILKGRPSQADIDKAIKESREG